MKLMQPKCIFCNRDTLSDTKTFFFSKNNEIYICSHCIASLNESIDLIVDHGIATPRDIRSKITDYIYGQDHVVKKVSVMIYKHLLSIENYNNNKIKSNMLVIGPTGSGKTYIFEIAAKILNIPFIVIDCTSLTAVGYVGDDIETCLGRLIKKCDNNINEAEKAIIIFDEFDKLARKSGSESNSNFRDISGEAVQQEMLKIIEGVKLEINPDNKRPHFSKFYTVDTSKMLFVAVGCFYGIDQKLQRSISNSGNKGAITGIYNTFGSQYNDQSVVREAVIKEGIIPELVGRFVNIGVLRKLDVRDIINIMKDSRGKLARYLLLFRESGVNFIIEEEIYEFIAEKVVELKLGARGISYFIDQVFDHFIFEIDKLSKEGGVEISLNIEMIRSIIENQIVLA